MEDAGNPLFGDGWRGTPRGAGALYVPAPVGETCLGCGEEIADDDSGEIMPLVTGDGEPRVCAQHRECLMLSVLGHTYGLCAPH